MGSQPQHHLKEIVNTPLASVTAVDPTFCDESHHQKKSTSYAVTCAPGAGLPFGHTTRPVIVISGTSPARTSSSTE